MPSVMSEQAAPRPAPVVAARPAAAARFGTVTSTVADAWKLGIYSEENLGKTSLAASCPGVTICDIEGSTARMAGVRLVTGVNNWQDLRAWAQSLSGKQVVALDTLTRAEDWCAEYVIKTKASNDGKKATDSLEDYKYKAGQVFVHDEFRRFLGDIDQSVRRGVSWIMIAHCRVNRFNNPDDANFTRYEPRLADGKDVSNMATWVQFLDFLALITLDVVIERGKATGGGSRTICLTKSPSRMAKVRGDVSNADIVYTKGSTELWERLQCK